MISSKRETFLLLGGDLLLLALSLWLALYLRALSLPAPGYYAQHLTAFAGIFALSILIFFIAGLYEHQTRLIRRVLGIRIVGAQAATTLIAAVFFFLLPLSIAPKTVLAIYLVVSVVLISAWRFFLVPYFSIASREKALIIGSGEAVEQLYREINGNTKYYLKFVSQVDPERDPRPLADALDEAIKGGVKFVVLDTRDARVRAELPSLYTAMLSGAVFSEFSEFYESVYDRVPLAHVDHAWLLEYLPKKHLAYDAGKRAFDIVGATIGGLIALPFILLGALLLLPGGSPFLFHDRIGRGGKTFRIVKLRSMLFNDHGDPELQKKNRVTPLGKILRKTRVDELPQLFNILKGDLSFIGPRPELPAIAQVYEREIPYYHVRHLITPGLSGWAQIYDYDAPRGAADVERTARKLSYDLYYLKNRSFGLDLAIALKTLRALASLSGS